MMCKKHLRNYDLQERLIDFSIRVLNVVESLPTSLAGNHVANQLVRSGTSPAANYGEAQSAESRRDFIHKMKVALKELRETLVWILIIQRKPLVEPLDKFAPLIEENNELISIFVSSVVTAQENLKK
ncbi:MAG: four helix bundle protein [Pirellulales bacterium]